MNVKKMWRLQSSAHTLRKHLSAVPRPDLMGTGSYAFAYHKMTLHLSKVETQMRQKAALN